MVQKQHRRPEGAVLPNSWSGKRDSNSRPQPWQGCALPTELFPRAEQSILLHETKLSTAYFGNRAVALIYRRAIGIASAPRDEISAPVRASVGLSGPLELPYS